MDPTALWKMLSEALQELEQSPRRLRIQPDEVAQRFFSRHERSSSRCRQGA